MTFLKAQGIRGLVGKNDWPRYTEEEPGIYEREELNKLFAVCGAEERLWYEFFLMTGEREQEVMYTEWPDINLAGSIVRVTHKPNRNWTPKADKKCGLVFPTAGCNPKLNFFDNPKSVAERAKLGRSFPLVEWHPLRSAVPTRASWTGEDARCSASSLLQILGLRVGTLEGVPESK